MLQLLRIGTKELIFSAAERTLLSDAVFNLAFMSVLSCCFIAAAQRRNCRPAILPVKFSTSYIIATVIVAVIFILTPVITLDVTLYGVLFLLYGAGITPIYEELIFRGFIWEAMRQKSDKTAYLVSTLLFAVWHIGYADTVLWRTSLFFPDENVLEIMFWKVITGLVIGVILGGIRYKTKNAYSAMLLHCLINTVGG